MKFLRLLLGLALVSTLMALVPGSAQAYTITDNRSGAVRPTVYKVQSLVENLSQSPVARPPYKGVFQSGPVVSRIRPSGQESVRVNYTVYKWNGSSWVVDGTYAGSATIASTATSVKLPNLRHLKSASAAYYSVQLKVTWTSPIGAVLGSFGAAMNEARDYTCTYSACTVGAGWIQVR